MASTKVQKTTNYRLFTAHSAENRETNAYTHRVLLQSMKEYGFLSCFPIVVFRDKRGDLVVKDGQHRLLFAETLGLPVYWIEETKDFDVALVNSGAKGWVIKDYVKKHAANGKSDYQEALDFSSELNVPLGTAIALLSGTTSLRNVSASVMRGDWQIKDREWAEAVAKIYAPLLRINSKIRNARFIEACMAVCRVEGFDSERLIRNVTRCPEKLQSYSSRDAYLDMLEAIYNFGRQQLVGLKAAAIMTMRERGAVKKPA